MSNRDPFGHRKYHGLYFILGFLIAFVAFMMLSGCEQGKTDSGVDCIGMAGMTYEGQQCEPEPPMCCMALIPACMACGEGIPEDVWIRDTCGENAIGAEYAGWDEEKKEPIWLCEAVIIN